MTTATILCVDDERNVLLTLRTQLMRHFPDYTIEIAESAAEALALVDELRAEGVEVPLVIADQIMPGMRGDQLLIELHRRYPEMLKVMLTGQARAEDVGNVVNHGKLYRFLAKPWNEMDLQLTVAGALECYAQERQLAQQQATLEQTNRTLEQLIDTLEQQVQERTQQWQESEERYRLLSEISPVGIFRNDRQGRCTYANRKALEMTGLSLEENLGDGWGRHLHPQDHDMMYATWADFTERINRGQRAEYAVEHRYLYPDQSLRWAIAQSVPEYNAAGELTGFVGSVVDITERKQAELALQQALEFSQQVIATAQEGIIVWDCDLRYRVWNRFMEDLSGVPAAGVLGEYCLDVFPFLRENGVFALLERALAGETVYAPDACFSVPTTGRSGCTSESFTPLRDAQGKITGVLATVHDITARKQAEAAQNQLVKQLSGLKFALDQAAIVATTDAQGRITYVNDRFCEISQYARAELMGQTHKLINSGYHPRSFFQDLWKTISSGRVWKGEIKNLAKDGSEYWVDTVIVPFLDDRGQPFQYMAIRFEVTERKQVEEALRRSEASLTDAQRIAQLGHWEFDLATQGLTWSSQMFQIFGLDPTQPEPTYAEFQQMIEPDDWPAMAEAIGRAIATATPYELEHRILRPDGSVRYLLGKGEAVLNAQGQVIKLRGTGQDITSTKQAEMALRQSEEQFRQLAENIREVFYVYNLDPYQMLYISPAFENIWGIPGEMLRQDPWLWIETIHPEDRDRVIQMAERQQQGQSFQEEYRIIRPDGEIRWISARSSPIADPTGRFYRVVGICEDITARKLAELALQESEAQNRAILSAVPDIMTVINADGRYLSFAANQFAGEILSPESWNLAGLHVTDILPEGPAQQCLAAIQRALETGQTQTHEHRLQFGDRIQYEEVRIVPYKQNAVLSMVRDISDRKAAEAALRESENLLSMALSGAKAGVWKWDVTTNQTYWSEGNFRLLGYEPGSIEPSYDAWMGAIHPDDLERVQSYVAQISTLQGEVNLEYRVLLPNGAVRWLSDIGQIILNEQGHLSQMTGIQIDITERKQATIELQEREAQLQAIAANVPGGVFRFVYHADGRHSCVFASEGYRTLLGVDPELLRTDPELNLSLVHPDDRLIYEESAAAALAGQETSFQGEVRYVLPAGEVKWIATTAQLSRVANGDVIVDGIDIDITYRKQIEAEITQSRDLREAIFNESADALFLVDPETGRTLDCNNRAVALFEAGSKADLIQNEVYALHRQPWTPEECDHMLQEIRSRGFANREVEYQTRQGNSFWGSLAINQISVAGGVLNLVRVTDISDRKRVAQSLLESREFIRSIAESSPSVIYIYDLAEHRNVYVNREVCGALGYSVEEFHAQFGGNLSLITHSEDQERVYAHLNRLRTLPEGQIAELEYRMQHRDGEWRWFASRDTVFKRDADGRVVQIVGSALDISARKQIELALAASERLYASLAEASPVAIYRHDASGHCIYVNDRWCSMTGLTAQQGMGGEWQRAVHPEDRDRIRSEWDQAVSAGLPFRSELRYLRPDGTVVWVYSQAVPELDPEGRVLGYVGTTTDITALKQAEAALRESEAKYRRIVETANEGIWIVDTDNKTSFINPKMSTMLGYSVAEMLGKPIFEFMDAAGVAIATRNTERRRQGISEQHDFKFQHKNGTEVWTLISTNPIQDEAGRYIGSLAMVTDISERKKLEIELSQREAFLNSIYNGVEVAISVIDVEAEGVFRYIDLNPTAGRLAGGLDLATLRNRTLDEFDFFRPAEKEFTRHQLQQCVDTGEMVQFEVVLHLNGQEQWWLTRHAPLKDETGKVYRMIGTSIPITERKRAETQLASQNALLSRIARGEPLQEMLRALVAQLEQALPHSLCSVLLIDHKRRFCQGAALSLPESYCRAVEGVEVSDGVGSCGTAASRNCTIVSAEIASDPLWENYQDLARSHDLQACWSTPIADSKGQVLGTFAVYYRQPRSPQPQELELLEQMARIAGIAIERDRTEAQIRRSEEQLRLTLEFTGIGAWSWHPAGEYHWNGKMEELLELPLGLTDMFQRWCDRIHPQDVDRVATSIERAIASGTAFAEEYRYRLLNGRSVWRWVMGQGIYTGAGEVERVLGVVQDITALKQAEIALQSLVEGTASVTGADFFPILVQQIAAALNVSHVAVSRLVGDQLHALAAYADHQNQDPFSYQIEHTPCGASLQQGYYYCPTHLQAEFPLDPDLVRLNLNSYLGLALRNSAGEAIGIICILDHIAIPEPQRAETLLRIFGARAAAELERLQTLEALQQLNAELEQRVQQRTREFQQQTQLLQTILNSMGDGVLVADTHGNILLHNPAAEQMSGLGIAAPGHAEQALAQHNLWGIYLPDGTPCAVDQLPLFRAMQGESVDRAELVLRSTRQSHEFYTETTARPLYDANQVLIGGVAVFRDVTERRQAEEALRQKEKQYRTIFEAVSDGIFINDLETGRLVEVNLAACQMYGCTYEELIGTSMANYVCPDTYRSFEEYMTMLKQGTAFRTEAEGIRRDGSCFDTEIVGTPFLLNGKLHALGLMRDISDRKRAEAAIQRSERDLRTIFNNVYDAIFIHDLNGTILDVNDRALELNRTTREQLLAASITDLSPPDAPMELLPPIFEQVQQGETVRFEWGCQRLGDRSTFISEVALRLVTLGDRSVYIAAVRDISDRKQAEQALRESQQFAQSIAENSPNIIYIYDLANHRNLYTNRELVTTLGYTGEQVRAMGSQFLPSLIHPEDFPELQLLFDHLRVASDGDIVELEYRMRHADGSWHWLYDRVAVFKRDATGQVIQYIGVVQDVTDRKQAEQALRDREIRFRSVVECNMLGIGFWEGSQVTYANQALLSMIGYTQAELETGQIDWQNLTPSDYWSKDAEAFAQTQATGSCTPYEKEYICKDGSRLPIVLGGGHFEGDKQRGAFFVLDIRDRKQTEQALQQSEQRFRTLFEATPNPIQGYDKDRRVIFWNSASEAIYGYSREEALGRTVEELIIPQEMWPVLLPLVDAWITGKGAPLPNGELELQDKNRQLLTVYSSHVMLTNMVGEKEMYCIDVDLRDRKRTEAQLRNSEARLRTLIDNIPFKIWMRDSQQRLLLQNVVDVQYYGDALGTTPEEIGLSPEVLSDWQHDLNRVLQGETIRKETVEWIKGHLYHFYSILAPVVMPSGEINVMGVSIDISDRKQAEVALQEAQQFAQSIADKTPAALYIYDLVNQCNLYSNRSIFDALGYTGEEILAMGPDLMSILLHPDDFAAVMRHQQAILAAQDGQDLEVEYRMRHANGEWRWLYSRDSAFKRDAAGRVTQYIGAAQDITDRKQSEENLRKLNAELESRVEHRTAELKEAKEAAEAANRAKSTFLTNMSHELRTPLNAILGFSQLLNRNTSLDIEQQQQINIINRSGEHLLNLINDVLEMSKIEAGRITLSLNNFDLQKLLDHLRQMFHLKARMKGLHLLIESAPGVPQYIRTDENKLRQVLINLVGNAIKFTPQGSVWLRVQMAVDLELGPVNPATVHLLSRADAALPPDHPLQSPILLHFSVADTGPGIGVLEQEVLFKPFVQTKTGQESQEGTGLGLPISQQFVQLMGGELSVLSAPGQGSTFYFQIPVNVVLPQELSPQPPIRKVIGLALDQPGYRILVVEDNWENRQFLVQLLRSIGFEVRDAENGQQAIALWQQWSPHLVWMDMRMPILDGYEATRQIRVLEAATHKDNEGNPPPEGLEPVQPYSASPGTKILALTASAFETERAAILAAGCDDLVCKPATEATLFEKMSQHLGVAYLYQEETELPVRTGQDEVSHPSLLEALQGMPLDWITGLERAARIADDELIYQFLEQIPAAQTFLADALRELVNELRLDKLIGLTAIALRSHTREEKRD